MRKLLLLLFLLSVVGMSKVGHAQAGYILYVSSAPSGTCSQGSYQRVVIGPGTVYTCQSGTWTQVGSGGACATCLTGTNPTLHGVMIGDGTQALAVTAAGTTGQVLTGVTGAAPVWAAATGGITTSTTGPPGTPTVANVGSAGVVTYTYKVVARQGQASTATHSAASSVGTTTTGNATLNASNYNVLSAYQIYNPGGCFDIYRVSGGSSQGLIASCVGYQYADQGASGDSSTAPTTDTTVLAASSAYLGQTMQIGQVASPDLPPTTPNAKDEDASEINSIPDPRFTWINQSANATTGTAVGSNGDIVVQGALGNGAWVFSALCETLPSAPYTVTGKFALNVLTRSSNNQHAYIDVTDNSAKAEGLQFHNTVGVTTFSFNTWASLANGSGGPSETIVGTAGMNAFVWVKIKDDSTNLKIFYSNDGRFYSQIHTEAHTAFLTAVNVCFGSTGSGTADVVDLILGNLRITTP